MAEVIEQVQTQAGELVVRRMPAERQASEINMRGSHSAAQGKPEAVLGQKQLAAPMHEVPRTEDEGGNARQCPAGHGEMILRRK